MICVGPILARESEWHSLHGKTCNEYTICEWCIQNGCVAMEDVYLTNVKNGTCDCEIEHPRIEQYICKNCYSLPKDKDEIEKHNICGKCNCEFSVSIDNSHKICLICSAVHRLCVYCGCKESTPSPSQKNIPLQYDEECGIYYRKI